MSKIKVELLTGLEPANIKITNIAFYQLNYSSITF